MPTAAAMLAHAMASEGAMATKLALLATRVAPNALSLDNLQRMASQGAPATFVAELVAVGCWAMLLMTPLCGWLSLFCLIDAGIVEAALAASVRWAQAARA